MKKYRCTVCDWVYDPEVGDPDAGIEPGTAFGEVEETGILIAEDEILEEKRRRHIDSFLKEHPDWQRDLSQILMINRHHCDE